MARIGHFGLAGWIGISISVALVAWLAATYDLKDLMNPLRRADYIFLLPVPALVLLNFAVRAFRWRSLFLGYVPKSMGKVFRAMMVGYLFNNLMPAHAGDLVRVYQLSRDEGLSKSKTLATLFAERTGDLLVLILLLSGVLLFYPALPHWLTRAGKAAAVVTVGVVTILVILKVFGKKLSVMVASIAGRVSQHLESRIELIGENFLSGLSGLFNPRSGVLFLALTGIIWSAEVAVAYLVGMALKLNLPLGSLLFVLIAIAAGTLVPSSPGYIGTFEFFGISALGMVGVSGGEALSFVVTLHAITIFGAGILGAVCLVGWRRHGVGVPGELREPIK